MDMEVYKWEYDLDPQRFDFDMIEKRTKEVLHNFGRVSKWQFENYDRVKEVHKEWAKINPERVKKIRKKYVDTHRPEIRSMQRKYQSKRYKDDPVYRLNKCIRSNIGNSLRGLKACRHWESLVGYTLDELVKHLELQFWKDDNITWDNYGKYWHVDHIKPIASFNYKTAEDEEFKECWALRNLQPLEASANLSKSDNW